MDKKLKPIIKWTGGKYNEFALFANEIPKFNRYIEPFFGGGGVFFALQPKLALLNDKSADLITFYRQIGSSQLKKELDAYVDAWYALNNLVEVLFDENSAHFDKYIAGQSDIELLLKAIQNSLNEQVTNYPALADPDFLVQPSRFNHFLECSLIDKAKRIRRIAKREDRKFNRAELKDHFETGIRSGLYLFFRNILNQNFNKIISMDPAKSAANWYFIREFCYGSMFRFNRKNEFNIPYGGISYNKKNFRQKVVNLTSDRLVKLFTNASFENLDFETFLTSIVLTKDDFIFLDPPYDSEFSEYDQNSFTKNDQKRLAKLLIGLPAKWMVVIKETPFIRQLYTAPNVWIKTFEKSYTYNMRGRNQRAVQHLLITNYN